MGRHGVLIPDGESTLAKFVIHGLAFDRSIDIHVLSKDPAASIKHSRHVSSFEVYDPAIIGEVQPASGTNPSKEMAELIKFHHYDASKGRELVTVIINHARQVKASVLLPVDEHIVRILSIYTVELAQAGLQFAIPDHDLFIGAIDKWELSKILSTNKIPHPVTELWDLATSDHAVDRYPFPVIVKPVDQGNALGIRSFTTATEMREYFQHHPREFRYIVQPLIDGYDIDCSVLCRGGDVVAFTIQRGIVAGANRFRAAVGIEFLDDPSVISVVRPMMKLLNWEGVAHIDLRFDSQAHEVKVIEINARYWGSLLGSLNAGVNFPALAVRSIVGEKFEMPSYANKRYFMGKAPMKRILTTLFSGKTRVKVSDTSLYYSLRDIKPVLAEIIQKIKARL